MRMIRRCKQSTPKLSSLAGETLADPKASKRAKSLAGSVLAQDETPKRKRKAKKAVRREVDPEKLAETQSRLRRKTADLKAGKVPGRARLGPTR